MVSHIHLDLVGGLSGDMFISGMLDAFPEFSDELDQVIVAAGFPDLVRLESSPHDDGVLTGTRFRVSSVAQDNGDHKHDHPDHHHHHRHYSDIRDKLEQSALDPETQGNALEIFRLIAEVEAAIHGKKVDEVAFHEVGAWDSIADVVLSAYLIAKSGAGSWSISAIPAGSGFVETAHGRLPVPAPATARLLEGFELMDDGLEGERVTPTGAGIIRFLSPTRRIPPGQILKGTGYGFGTKVFPGISNTVRVSTFESADQAASTHWQEDQVMRLSFELDDQTPESIAAGLEQLRTMDGVLEVTQQVYFGKKHRQGFTIAVLCREDVADNVTLACFSVTTTLGVRRERVARAKLRREEVVVYVGERAYRVKVSERPTGYTAKVEMDDLVATGFARQQQEQIRAEAETLAIRQVQEESK